MLLKWLETPHVKKWWDNDVKWTEKLIQKKYLNYVKGYTDNESGIAKAIYVYIIKVDNKEIGYVQYYNAYDFPRSCPLNDLPNSLAAFDIFIGEGKFIGKGLGSKILLKLLKLHIEPKFEYCFADPDIRNIVAIKAYQKAGFKIFKEVPEINEVWMLRKNNFKKK